MLFSNCRKGNKMGKKNTFKRATGAPEKVLICPDCFESLFRNDIEHFGKCPYCDQKINFDMEVEEYLLKPIVDRWLLLQKFQDEISQSDFPSKAQLNTNLNL